MVVLEKHVTPLVCALLVYAQEFTHHELCGVDMVLHTAAGEELEVLDTYMDICTTPEHATIGIIQTEVCLMVFCGISFFRNTDNVCVYFT